MDLVIQIKRAVEEAMASLYPQWDRVEKVQVNETKPEFSGNYTVVLFSIIKFLKRSPETVGQEIREALLGNNPHLFLAFNVVKGFLNITVSDSLLLGMLEQRYKLKSPIDEAPPAGRVVIEYSSPNTNKPLHLGHLRNNFLGWSVAEILRSRGWTVIKTCIANDRGIHICKSMVAWQRFGAGMTPALAGVKGDHFVGDFYVLFGVELKKEVRRAMESGVSPDQAEKNAPLMVAAQQMLVDWEAGKPDVISLWERMNGWVYAGFEETYRRIGSDFDKIYYESQTYLLGKDLVELGLARKIFFQKEDGSVWIDLTGDGLDQKILRRKDGTAVYITQDIGLVSEKHEEFHPDRSVYVVADEQNYHFKVLRLICERLELPGASGIHHLSYGLVELPSGRMKTREGTVVDADDILDEMTRIAASLTAELGKIEDFTDTERSALYDLLALGALKFFLLRVDPKKRMVFNPEESVDFHGFTGPFVQYSYARIRSILRKERPDGGAVLGTDLLPLEKQLLVQLEKFGSILREAAESMSPSIIANYVFAIAQLFNSFYSAHPVIRAETEEKKQLRLRICVLTSTTIQAAMSLLGIAVPERM